MNILLLEIDFHIAAAQSLKDKRGVVKSVIHALRTEYDASVAEVGHLDKWQLAGIALVAVSLDRDWLAGIERGACDMIEGRFGLAVSACEAQWL